MKVSLRLQVSRDRRDAHCPCPPHSHILLFPQIYFWEAQRGNLTERVKTLFLAENSVKLKNLTGYTAYMVSVAAFNAAGDGPRSTPTQGQTQQAGGRGGPEEGRGRSATGGCKRTHLASGLLAGMEAAALSA